MRVSQSGGVRCSREFAGIGFGFLVELMPDQIALVYEYEQVQAFSYNNVMAGQHCVLMKSGCFPGFVCQRCFLM